MASGATITILKDLYIFLRERKKWWIISIIVILLLMAALLIVSETVVSQFLYTIF